MKKDNIRSNLLDRTQTHYKSARFDKIKTTDINILLNRVKINEKIEFKNKIIFSLLIFLFTSFVGVFFLFLY